MVVIHHARLGFMRPDVSRWQDKLLALADGTLAVHIFFVLSGFVLSIGMLRRPSWDRLAGLALRRYPRLTLPILAITLAALVMMSSGVMFNHQAASSLRSLNNLGRLLQFQPQIESALRFALFDVYFRYDEATSYNTNLWTMPIEFVGSFLVFGLLTLVTWRRVFLFTLAVGIVWSAMARSAFLDFFLGVLIAGFYSDTGGFKGIREISALSALLLTAAALRIFLPGQFASYVGIATTVVMMPIVSNRIRALFGTSLSRWLGRISFPLYLVHPLVIFSFSSWLALFMKTNGVGELLLRDLVIGATVAASLLAAQLFYPVESWAIRGSQLVSRSVLGALRRVRWAAA
jgi:peptidoglycan/LPS O-acetylase OafA/YrhL